MSTNSIYEDRLAQLDENVKELLKGMNDLKDDINGVDDRLQKMSNDEWGRNTETMEEFRIIKTYLQKMISSRN